VQEWNSLALRREASIELARKCRIQSCAMVKVRRWPVGLRWCG
jgi:hypothetical protein